MLEQCHVFVYPSRADGMPQPVLQAMAAGRPIVTTNIAGCRDTVDERVNGCLVAPRDAEALAEGMESYLKRPDLIPGYGTRQPRQGRALRYGELGQAHDDGTATPLTNAHDQLA